MFICWKKNWECTKNTNVNVDYSSVLIFVYPHFLVEMSFESSVAKVPCLLGETAKSNAAPTEDFPLPNLFVTSALAQTIIGVGGI